VSIVVGAPHPGVVHVPLLQFRFRRFSRRLLAFFAALLLLTLGTTFALVSHYNTALAQDHAKESLEKASVTFEESVQRQIAFLVANAGQMSRDYALRQVLQKPDQVTVSSLLQSYTERVHSPVIVLLVNDALRTLVATSDGTMMSENLGPFRFLSSDCEMRTAPFSSGFSYLNGQLHTLVVVPLYAPEITHWVGLAFPIDREFAEAIKRTTNVDVTFVSTEKPAEPRVLSSTLPPEAAKASARAATEHIAEPMMVSIIPIGAERYVTRFERREMLGEDPISIVLQRPLRTELETARKLETYIAIISLAALVIGAGLTQWIARGVSQPIQQLVDHTRQIRTGDYTQHLELDRADEFGQLATAFNQMTDGLAERDRVRDLLDKNVSPEIAAQLLRDGATLGGEEREVTILFADLRGFTTLSEKLPPAELLGLLNRYLDRMSAEIEKQGGIIDKFIGDAIMALFGAPVGQADAADRALAAASAMERALIELNRELAAEAAANPSRGLPTGLALGIGVNTARVVAGNIGTQRRLNYSVIGDGVNVAARLQSLTRTTEYRTNIITSAATLAALREGERFPARSLGRVQVKGRAEPVEIFAID
jgi:adenylate cyclase